MEEIKQKIKEIEKRNARVEMDKAWETSWTRRLTIAILTYIVISIFFTFAGFSKPFVNAIVPTMGFLLSTPTVSFVKNIWIKRQK